MKHLSAKKLMISALALLTGTAMLASTATIASATEDQPNVDFDITGAQDTVSNHTFVAVKLGDYNLQDPAHNTMEVVSVGNTAIRNAASTALTATNAHAQFTDPISWVAENWGFNHDTSGQSPYDGNVRDFIQNLATQTDIVNAISTSTIKATGDAADASGNAIAHFNIPNGIYLIEDTTPQPDPNTGTMQTIPMLISTKAGKMVDGTSVNLPGMASSAQVKSTYLKKPVKNVDSPTHKVGDSIKFTINSTVPLYTHYDPSTYILQVNDQLSAGLTYDSSLLNPTVKIGNTTLATGQYELSVFNQHQEPVSTVASSHTTAKGASFVFNLSAYIKGKMSIHDYSLAGQPIEITYTVVLNDDAIAIDHGDSKNSATVTYKDNQSTDCHGTTTPSVEKHVYTFNFSIKKISKSEGTVLPGTEFQIFQGTSTTPMPMYSDGNGGYRPPQTGEASVDKLVVPASGTITISGVDAGTYTLKEIKPADGYIIPTDFKFSVTITPSFRSDQTLDSVNYSAPADDLYGLVSKDDTNPQLYIVKNIKTVIDLPSTGKAGITIRVILGVLLAGAGAGIYLAVRKNQRSHVSKNAASR